MGCYRWYGRWFIGWSHPEYAWEWNNIQVHGGKAFHQYRFGYLVITKGPKETQ
jgi:hypothetical protein